MNQSNSFSKMGQKLDRVREATLRADKQQFLNKILKAKMLSSKSKSQIKISKVFQTISRQKLSTFQRCHTKQINTKAIYQQKIQAIKLKPPVFSISKHIRPPLFILKSGELSLEAKCEKCDLHQLTSTKNTLRGQNLKRIKSSQNLKCFDIEKQTPRPFEVQLSKIQKQMIERNSRRTFKNLNNEQENQDKLNYQNFKQKMRRTHSFTSYTSRKFLSSNKLKSAQSGTQCFKVEMGKYKKGQSNINNKFDKFVDKIRTRYDRDCEPWIAKLSYDIDDKLLTQNKTNYYQFSKQSERKLNQVHSKYPMRMAL